MRLFPAAVMIAGCAATLGAQAPTFRTGTTLVEFSVVAFDGDENPVTDLKQEDFVVLENGSPKEIAFFRFDAAPEKIELETLPPGLYTNRPQYTAKAPRGVTAIVIDGVNSAPFDQLSARAQLMRYLTTIPEGTRVALFQAGWRIRVLHDYTSDVASLRSKVAQIMSDAAAHAVVSSDATQSSGTMSVEAREMMATALADMQRQEEGYSEQVEDRKRAVTLASLEAIGRHLASAPGRKSLVWLTLGTPIHTNYQQFFRNHEPQIRRTAERLATQGVAVYPVDIQGLKGVDLRTGRAQGVIDQRQWAMMNLMADVTGGRFSRNTNDMAEGLKVAGNDLRGSYTIGFYTANDADLSWRNVDLNVSRNGVRLTHRKGYLLEGPAPKAAEWSDEHWRSAITQPLSSTVVRLDARFEPIAGAEPGTHGLLLQIASDDLHFRKTGDRLVADVDIAIAEKVPTGGFAYRKNPMTFSLPEAADSTALVMRYTDRWKIRQDATSLRVIVRDRSTGRYGTLDFAVNQKAP